MNNLWREIAVNCWEERTDGLHFDQEKFADLLINECLYVCYFRGMNTELYEGQLQAAKQIEKHFGME